MSEEQLVASWDACDIIDQQAKFLIEQAKEEGNILDEKSAWDDAAQDSDIFNFEWDCMTGSLANTMEEMFKDEIRFCCEVSNFGWRHLNGYKFFTANNGQELLSAILPKTDCTFKIYRAGDTLKINNSHHDAPTGETYTVHAAPICEYCGDDCEPGTRKELEGFGLLCDDCYEKFK